MHLRARTVFPALSPKHMTSPTCDDLGIPHNNEEPAFPLGIQPLYKNHHHHHHHHQQQQHQHQHQKQHQQQQQQQQQHSHNHPQYHHNHNHNHHHHHPHQENKNKNKSDVININNNNNNNSNNKSNGLNNSNNNNNNNNKIYGDINTTTTNTTITTNNNNNNNNNYNNNNSNNNNNNNSSNILSACDYSPEVGHNFGHVDQEGSRRCGIDRKRESSKFSPDTETSSMQLPPKSNDPFSPQCLIPLPSHLLDLNGGYEPAFIRKRNERERERVRCVNEGYAQLKKHLPLSQKDKRLSKVETLRTAIHYIRYLEDILDIDRSKGKT